MRWLSSLILWLLLQASAPLHAAIPRADIVAYVTAERAAERVPDITGHFGNDLWGSDFSKLNLAGVDFSHADLGDCKFHDSDLRKSTFSSAHLYLAEFFDTDLRGADFIGCSLDRCHFDRADLRESLGFGLDFVMGVTAKGANLSGLSFARCDLASTDFSGADLSRCDFTLANGVGAKFTGANWSGVMAKEFFVLGARGLTQADLDTLDQAGAIASATSMQAAVDRGVSFVGKKLDGAQLNDLNLEGVDFSDCDLRGANFTNSKLKHAQFVRSELAFAQFHHASMQQANFTEAHAHGVNFSHADLTAAEFRHANVSYAHFKGSQLTGARFVRAKVERSNFESAVGSPTPPLAKLQEESGYAAHQLRTQLLDAVLGIAPLLGLLAFIIMIIAAVTMWKNPALHPWTKFLILISFVNLLAAPLLAVSVMSSSAIAVSLLAFLGTGSIVCLVGIFLGLSRLAQGQKKPEWPSIIFFAAAPFPGIGIGAVLLNALASV